MPDHDLNIKLLHDGALPPQRTRTLDAGYDLSTPDEFVLRPGERKVVGVGIAVALPSGMCGLVLPRSGLAAKHGITVVNAPGLIDPGYRGEIGVVLLNTGAETFRAQPGDRIAQLLLVSFLTPNMQVLDDLPASDDGRAAGGFGSSGR